MKSGGRTSAAKAALISLAYSSAKAEPFRSNRRFGIFPQTVNYVGFEALRTAEAGAF